MMGDHTHVTLHHHLKGVKIFEWCNQLDHSSEMNRNMDMHAQVYGQLLILTCFNSQLLQM